MKIHARNEKELRTKVNALLDLENYNFEVKSYTPKQPPNTLYMGGDNYEITVKGEAK